MVLQSCTFVGRIQLQGLNHGEYVDKWVIDNDTSDKAGFERGVYHPHKRYVFLLVYTISRVTIVSGAPADDWQCWWSEVKLLRVCSFMSFILGEILAVAANSWLFSSANEERLGAATQQRMCVLWLVSVITPFMSIAGRGRLFCYEPATPGTLNTWHLCAI